MGNHLPSRVSNRQTHQRPVRHIPCHVLLAGTVCFHLRGFEQALNRCNVDVEVSEPEHPNQVGRDVLLGYVRVSLAVTQDACRFDWVEQVRYLLGCELSTNVHF